MLTGEQLSLARHAWRGWQMAELIGFMDAGIRQCKSSMGGGCGGTWTYDTDDKGVHGTRRERTRLAGRHPNGRTRYEVTVTWTEWRQVVATLPAPIVARVAAAFREWQTEYVRWAVVPTPPGRSPRDTPWVEVPPERRRETSDAMDAAVEAALALLEPVEQGALF